MRIEDAEERARQHQQLIGKAAPHAATITDGEAWRVVKELLEFEEGEFLVDILGMNPYEGEPVTCGKDFLEHFYTLQSGIRARARAVEVIEKLAQAHKDSVQETEFDG